MAGTRAAQRYALAIIGIAEESKSLDRVARDFKVIEEIIRGSREFSLFLKSPVVSKEKKRSVWSDLFTGRLSELTSKFVLLLLQKDREGLLPEIVQQFQRLHDERLGILDVVVRTAIEFTKGEDTRLIRQLEQGTGKKVRLQYILDPSLRGGFVVHYGDTVLDASVRHQLERLRRQFVEGMA